MITCPSCREPNPESNVRCYNCDVRLDGLDRQPSQGEIDYDAPSNRERAEMLAREDRD